MAVTPKLSMMRATAPLSRCIRLESGSTLCGMEHNLHCGIMSFRIGVRSGRFHALKPWAEDSKWAR